MKTWEEVTEELKKRSSVSENILNEAEAMAKIIAEIIDKREEMGYSQRELAKICKLPQSSIARIESCRVIPKIDTLLTIMRPLGLTISVISTN